MQQGIVVGTDQHQEWLLPWWWERYSQKNSYPVLFVDFGMSAVYNWSPFMGEDPQALIIHHQGTFLKERLAGIK